MLHDSNPRNADREYVKVLHCAAHQNEELTDRALEQRIAAGTLHTHTDVEQLVQWWMQQQSVPPRIGAVGAIDLACYDDLLSGKGVAQ
jgi:hypothetical protein